MCIRLIQRAALNPEFIGRNNTMNGTAHNLREIAPEQKQVDLNTSQAETTESMEAHDFVPESTKRLTSSVTQTNTDSGAESTAKPRRPRGFAAMDRDLVSAIARKGGKAAHEAGTAHEFTSEEARSAGRKGGQATHAKRRAKVEPSS